MLGKELRNQMGLPSRIGVCNTFRSKNFNKILLVYDYTHGTLRAE